jgi:hypothetical protein
MLEEKEKEMFRDLLSNVVVYHVKECFAIFCKMLSFTTSKKVKGNVSRSIVKCRCLSRRKKLS